ncbi:MAG: PIN domain-containing protein, partial [Bacteroidota bacterium]
LAELKFGVANSKAVEKNQLALSKLLSGLQVLPIFDSIDMYASEKARLRKLGTPTDDFDLLIGATAVNHGMILVTNNTKHFEKIKGIRLENWVESV